MASRIQNMTEGKPLKLIFAFSLPLMIGNVFQQLYTVVDTMVVGQALGVDALAALGASDWLNWMVLGIIQGFTQGFSIMMAREFGAGNITRLKKVIGTSVVLAAGSSLVLLAASQLLAEPILHLLRTPSDIMPNSLVYLRVMFLGIPIIMAYNILASILRALGDGTTPLRAMLVASGINIVLDLIFVLVFRWGIIGAAAATVIAQFSSAVYCFLAIRKIEILSFTKDDFLQKHGLTLPLLKLGAPMAFQNAIIAIGGMIVQSVVNKFGVLFIAGFTATNKLYGILEIAATSYGYAMTTYVGQNFGARKIERIKKGLRSAVIVALLTSAAIAAVMLLLGRVILSWFISGDPEAVTQTMQIAYYYLAIMSCFLPILYLLHIYRSTLQGMGDTVLPMVSGIAEFVMRTATAILLPRLIGQNGIFFAEILAWAGADIILLTSYYIKMRKFSRQYT